MLTCKEIFPLCSRSICWVISTNFNFNATLLPANFRVGTETERALIPRYWRDPGNDRDTYDPQARTFDADVERGELLPSSTLVGLTSAMYQGLIEIIVEESSSCTDGPMLSLLSSTERDDVAVRCA